MQTTITDPTSGTKLPLANAYKYDQLNRIKEARSFTGLDVTNNVWTNTGTYNKSYYNFFEYDANGNILKQIRHTQDGTQIEDLTYQYHKNDLGKMIKNRLYHVNDAIGAGVNAGDIDDQGLFKAQTPTQQINGDNNYVYDAEGRLISDKQEKIDNIVWRVDGKIREIFRPNGHAKNNLIFEYDAMGNRIAKHEHKSGSGTISDPLNHGILVKSTYYILDAQGNCMNVYEHKVETSTATFELAERHIFGSSRLGMDIEKVDLLNPAPVSYQYTHTLGKKYYELTNHLGNVLSVVTDRITPLTLNTTSVSGYEVEIASSGMYSAFGVQLDGHTFTNGNKYRFGYQGSEKDDEVKGVGNSYHTFFRSLDPRLGRWLTIDPQAASLPWQSTYCSMDNNPISHNDILGDIVGYGSKGDKRRVAFKFLISKNFRTVHRARMASVSMYTYTRSTVTSDPPLGGREVRVNSQNVIVFYSPRAFGQNGSSRMPELVLKHYDLPIDIDNRREKKKEVQKDKHFGLLGGVVDEQNNLSDIHWRKKYSDSYKLRRPVPGKELIFSAGNVPNQVKVEDKNGNNLLEGSYGRFGLPNVVSEGFKLTLEEKRPLIINVSSSDVYESTNPDTGETRTNFDSYKFSYYKYVGLKVKFNIRIPYPALQRK